MILKKQLPRRYHYPIKIADVFENEMNGVVGDSVFDPV